MNLLNKHQLAEFLQVEPKTVNYLLYSNQIPKVRIGKEYRFVQEDIETWIKARVERPKKYNFLDRIR